MILLLTLWNHPMQWGCKTVDVEAVFLEGSIVELTFLEWPPGTRELGYTSVEDLEDKCIRLKKLIYGNVNAVFWFYRAYSDHLIHELGMVRCKTDSCVFLKQNGAGE